MGLLSMVGAKSFFIAKRIDDYDRKKGETTLDLTKVKRWNNVLGHTNELDTLMEEAFFYDDKIDPATKTAKLRDYSYSFYEHGELALYKISAKNVKRYKYSKYAVNSAVETTGNNVVKVEHVRTYRVKDVYQRAGYTVEKIDNANIGGGKNGSRSKVVTATKKLFAGMLNAHPEAKRYVEVKFDSHEVEDFIECYDDTISFGYVTIQFKLYNGDNIDECNNIASIVTDICQKVTAELHKNSDFKNFAVEDDWDKYEGYIWLRYND